MEEDNSFPGTVSWYRRSFSGRTRKGLVVPDADGVIVVCVEFFIADDNVFCSASYRVRDSPEPPGGVCCRVEIRQGEISHWNQGGYSIISVSLNLRF